MNTEQERAEFEAWARRHLGIPEHIAFNWEADWTLAALEGYRAGRAALQSQVNNEAADRVREFLDKWMQIRLNDKTVIYRLNDLELRVDDLRALLVLQSQDREDAERYRWLRDGGSDDIGVVSGLGCTDSGSSNVVGTYEYILDGEQLDSAIDHARRVEGGA